VTEEAGDSSRQADRSSLLLGRHFGGVLVPGIRAWSAFFRSAVGSGALAIADVSRPGGDCCRRDALLGTHQNPNANKEHPTDGLMSLWRIEWYPGTQLKVGVQTDIADCPRE
jgi:hypothetical protein